MLRLSLFFTIIAFVVATAILFSTSSTTTLFPAGVDAARLHQQQQQQQHVHMMKQTQQNNSSPGVNVPTIAKLRTDTVTISGFDGGASFGSQYHIAHSSQFRGAAFLSTIPYLCAEGTVAGSTNCLTDPILINLGALYTEAASLVVTGTVDPFSNLKNQYVRIGGSPDDSIVNVGGSKAAASMYSTYLGTGQVDTDFSLNGANHAWVTSRYGNDCGTLGAPYISNCPKSFADDSMQKLFSHMGLSPQPSASSFNASHLYLMDQQKFGANPTYNALALHGYVFVPPQCEISGSKAGQCHFHIHFHGCNQSSAVMYDRYALSTQLNEFAIANDVVVYYPQATPNVEFLNPLGCFDFYGYEVDLAYELAYATKDGGQVKIIQAIQQAFLNGFE